MKASLPFKYITAVKNGKHYVVFDYKDVNNKRKRKWVGTDLPEKCAKKILSAKVDEIVSKFSEDFMSGKVANISKAVSANADGSTDSSEYEFTEYLKHWLENAKPTSAFTTYDSYRHSIGRISEYFDREFPHLLLSEVTPLQLQKFYNDLYDLGRKGSTIRQYHVNIHRALKYAVKMDIIPANPDDKTDLPKAEKHESSFYNKEELDKLFEVFKGDRLELVVHIAAYYGLRKCEIIGLKWDAIDFEHKTLTVRRKVVCVFTDGKKEIRVENKLKTKSSVRTFPLIPHIERMLLERKRQEEMFSEQLGSEFDREYDGFVCRDNLGKLLEPNFVTGHFCYMVQHNNLKPLRFHDLRHSCASLLVASGVPMKAVQEWLGHCTFNVTANYYSHLEYSSRIESADKIARLLSGEGLDGTNEGTDTPEMTQNAT